MGAIGFYSVFNAHSVENEQPSNTNNNGVATGSLRGRNSIGHRTSGSIEFPS